MPVNDAPPSAIDFDDLIERANARDAEAQATLQALLERELAGIIGPGYSDDDDEEEYREAA